MYPAIRAWSVSFVDRKSWIYFHRNSSDGRFTSTIAEALPCRDVTTVPEVYRNLRFAFRRGSRENNDRFKRVNTFQRNGGESIHSDVLNAKPAVTGKYVGSDVLVLSAPAMWRDKKLGKE